MVHSAKELQPILKLGDKIYLRKNIKQVEVTDEVTKETRQEWQADEVMFNLNELFKQPTLKEIENNFEVYYSWAEQKRLREKEERRKKNKVLKLIDKEYTLVDLKETVDQLVVDSLM